MGVKLWTHKHQNFFSALTTEGFRFFPRQEGSPGGPRRGAAHLMKVVFPVEYWPTSRTMGLLSKSASSRAGE